MGSQGRPPEALNKITDLAKFNKNFDNYLEQQRKISQLHDQEVLNKFTEKENVQPQQLSISSMLVNMKDSLFNIADDIINLRINAQTFTKENRLFYLGLFLMLTVFLFYIMDMIFPSEEPPKNTIIYEYRVNLVPPVNGERNNINVQTQPVSIIAKPS
jgi:hypothetical protein